MSENWTVGELRAFLAQFPNDRPIRELYIDVEHEEGDVERDRTPPRPPVALINDPEWKP